MKINELKPKNVWKFFEEISQIPRCSGDEKAWSYDEIRDQIAHVWLIN